MSLPGNHKLLWFISIPVLSEAISSTAQSTKSVKDLVYHFGTFHFTALFMDYIIAHNFTTNKCENAVH